MIEFLKKVGVGKDKAKDLSYEEAYEVNKKILDLSVTDIQIGAFWSALRMKHSTLEELSAFLDSLKEETNFIETGDLIPIDIAIGYDGKNRSIHILPCAIFISAGAGAKIVGHGASNIPSKFGITYHEILNAMGCSYLSFADDILKSLELSGFAFYHQKFLNPKLYRLLPKRQEYGLRSYLNTVEKLLNPFKTTKVLIGVTHSNFIDKYIQLAFYSGFKDIFVVKGLEGGIEPFPNKETKVYTSKIFSISIFPKDLKEKVDLSKDLSVEENAKLCLSILKNEDNPFKDWAIITAGLIIYAYGLESDISKATKLAEESLRTGSALESFEIYKSLSSKATF
ncbi:MAG TPA: anthranilate phosphoribosyltransferase [Persephonella sp.]|nr:anthranilate phosphoribosyltransferase [Persephonella sp.]